jgi:hypothetical protein
MGQVNSGTSSTEMVDLHSMINLLIDWLFFPGIVFSALLIGTSSDSENLLQSSSRSSAFSILNLAFLLAIPVSGLCYHWSATCWTTIYHSLTCRSYSPRQCTNFSCVSILTWNFISLQVVIHSILTTRIVLNIRGAGNQPEYGKQSELHTSYLEMPVVTTRRRRIMSGNSWAQGQGTRVIELEPLRHDSETVMRT